MSIFFNYKNFFFASFFFVVTSKIVKSLFIIANPGNPLQLIANTGDKFNTNDRVMKYCNNIHTVIEYISFPSKPPLIFSSNCHGFIKINEVMNPIVGCKLNYWLFIQELQCVSMNMCLRKDSTQIPENTKPPKYPNIPY